MPQLCSKCSRANPPEAVYCYFDGFVLAGHERRGGPVSIGSQPFNSPFVFPTGRSCRSFDELALACQEEWSVACGLLRDGYLESFLGGMGRIDLALAAKLASRFPDEERGLDQLLEKLPSGVLADPKLRIDPGELNLGLLDNPNERVFELELENVGGRLLYGTVSCSDPWISLAAGVTEKHFQITGDTTIAVHLRPDRVRASSKPIEAKIHVESNGGIATMFLRAEKPVQVFPDGLLKGARTPRQIAELALKNPKDVAPFFESGAVEGWYQTNGWIYPVKTPAASGIAAIQQFFEALGVSRAPQVEISQRSFAVTADPGAMLELSLDVTSQEQKAAWAHASSNVPWLEVGKAKCNKRTASISMMIPSVPNRPGEVLEGEVTVIGNGNTRWQVPVRVEVSGMPASAFDFDAPATPAAAPPPPPPPVPAKSRTTVPRPAKTEPRRKPRPAPFSATHFVPAGLLALALLGVVGFDLATRQGTTAPPEGKGSELWNYNLANLRDPKPRIGVSFNTGSRFGVVISDPDNPNAGVSKKLTYSPTGDTNNTVIKIGDGSDGYIFGEVTPNNVFVGEKRQPLRGTRRGWITWMRFKSEQVLVKQHVEIVPGRTALLDTCLVYYMVRNENTIAQNIGIRVMLDTYIGSNDGAPFTIPGEKGFVAKQRDVDGDALPDYVEVVEKPDDSNDPGTTARLTLKGLKLPGVELTEPNRLVISRYLTPHVKWDFERVDIKRDEDKQPDSSVTIYWPVQELDPKATRHYAFTYGLGELDLGDQMALSVPSAVVPGRSFVVTCYVYKPQKGQQVKLDLPDGLTLASGESQEKTVEGEEGKRTQVFWRVQASKEGTFNISASSGAGRSRETKVVVKAGGLFG